MDSNIIAEHFGKYFGKFDISEESRLSGLEIGRVPRMVNKIGLNFGQPLFENYLG